VQQRREDRAVTSAARKTVAAEKKAARAKEKADKMELKQLQGQSSVLVRRPRGRSKKQTAAEMARASPVKAIT
jgi:hypothetical protein